MEINVSVLSVEHDFLIQGASYAGSPKSNTMMFITKKVGHLVDALGNVDECLVFLENGIEVSNALKEKHCFVFSDNPQLEYAKFATQFAEQKMAKEAELGYELTAGHYYVGKGCVIGKKAYIEPGVLIGHNVIIGDNAVILAGAVIKNAVIGDNFLCNERAVVGSYGFTMAEDEVGNKFRIPSLGKVVIGNNVEIGAGCNVSVGSCGDTVIEDYVKIDTLVHISHEVFLHKNTLIAAGSVLGGFSEIQEKSFLGLNSTIKNRIKLGKSCIIGMGANISSSVPDNCTVAVHVVQRKLYQSQIINPIYDKSGSD